MQWLERAVLNSAVGNEYRSKNLWSKRVNLMLVISKRALKATLEFKSSRAQGVSTQMIHIAVFFSVGNFIVKYHLIQ